MKPHRALLLFTLAVISLIAFVGCAHFFDPAGAAAAKLPKPSTLHPLTIGQAVVQAAWASVTVLSVGLIVLAVVYGVATRNITGAATIGVAGVALLSLSRFLGDHDQALVWAGGAIFVGAAAWVVWKSYQHRNDLTSELSLHKGMLGELTTAINQVPKLAEQVKDQLSPASPIVSKLDPPAPASSAAK